MKKFLRLLYLSISMIIGGITLTSCFVSGGGQTGPVEPSEPEPHVCEFNLVDVINATCSKEGYERYECECGQYKETIIPPTGKHKLSDWEINQEPTYDEEGFKTRFCFECDYTEIEKIPCIDKPDNPENPDKPVEPENPDNPDEPENPNENEGHQEWHILNYEFIDMVIHKVYCGNCEYSYEEEHQMMATGKEEICISCGYCRSIECNHEFIFTYNDTCHYEYCIICGEVKNELEHNLHNEEFGYDGYVCNSYQEVLIYCDQCEYRKTEFTYVEHQYVNWAKYDDDYCGMVCMYCGEFNIDTLTAHEIYFSETYREPSYYVEGIVREYCSNCDSHREVTIPTSEHTCDIEIILEIEPTCHSNGYYVYQCMASHCGRNWEEVYSGPVDHDYVYTTIEEPTCYDGGTQNITCSYDCGYSMTTSLGSLGHNYVNGTCTRCECSETAEYFEYDYWVTYYQIIGIKEEYFEKYCLDGSGTVEFPASYNGLPVKEINLQFDPEEVSILNKFRLCDIVVPEGVTDLTIHTAYNDIRGYWNNKKFYLPSTLTYINGQLFDERDDKLNSPSGSITIYYNGTITSWLTNVYIEYVNTLPDITEFYTKEDGTNYTLLENLVIDSSIDTIKQLSLEGILSLKTLIVPETVTTIGSHFVEGCYNLRELTIPFIGEVATDYEYEFDTIVGNYLINLQKLTVTGGSCALVSNLPALVSVDFSGVVLERGNEFSLTDCVALKEVKFPQNLDTIPVEAFAYCRSLEKLELPSTVMAIESSAFAGCLSLEEIVLPNGLTHINSYAFDACQSLKELNIPNSVTNISDKILAQCYSITKANIPSSLVSLNTSTPIFADCRNLTTFEIGLLPSNQYFKLEDLFGSEGIKRLVSVHYTSNVIPDVFFKDCINLEEVTFETTNLTSIGSEAFKNCYKLNNLSPLFVSGTIGQSAFENCTALTSITVEVSSINSIDIFKGCTSLEEANTNKLGASMFENCTSLEEVNVSSIQTEIPSRCFYNCNSLTTVNCNKNLTSIDSFAFALCSSLSVFDLSLVDGYIGENAFYESGIKEVILTNNITVYDHAFNMTSIDKLTIHAGVELAAYAITSSVDHLIVDGSVTTANNIPYANKVEITGTSLEFILGTRYAKEVVLTEGLTSICDNALYRLEEVEEIVLPSSLTSLGRAVFSNYVEKITLKSLVVLSSDKFDRYPTIKHIVYNQSEILGTQFSGLSTLEKLELIVDITTIGDYAFDRCSSLSEISIENVEYIGSYAFQNCSSLTSIVIKNDNLEISQFDPFDNSGVTEFVLNKIPENFLSASNIRKQIKQISILNENSIPDNAFQNMEVLEKVELNDEITSIGYMAFAYCYKLVDIELPTALQEIKNQAFYNCRELSNVTFGENFTTLGNYAFEGCISLYQVRNLSSSFVVDKANKKQTLIYVVNVFEDNTPFKEVKKSGEYHYVENEDGIPVVVRYEGVGGDIVLPNKINNKSYYIGDYGLHYLRVTCGTDQVYTNCENQITSVTFSSNVIDIGIYVLNNNNYVHTLKTHKLYTYFDCMFDYNEINSGITTLELLDGVTSLPDYSLYGFADLRTLIIPSSVTSISELFVQTATRLIEIVNESNCEINRGYVNYYTSKENYTSQIVEDGIFKYVYSKAENKYYLYDLVGDSHSEVIVPAKYNNKEVAIYTRAFNNVTIYDLLELSEGITTLREQALSGITSYGAIKLPSTLSNIYPNAIYEFTTNEIYLPELVDVEPNTIKFKDGQGEFTLHYAGTIDSFISLVIANQVAGRSAFKRLEHLYCLDEYGVEYEVDTLDLSAYDYVEIPEELFWGHYWIKTLILPAQLKTIKTYAFSSCVNLQNVYLPEGLEVLEDYALSSTTSLKSITLPSTLTSINKALLSSGLETITIPGNIKNIPDSAFYGCNSLKSVIIEEGVESIGEASFYYAHNLSSVTLPTTLKSIGRSAFFDCAIEEIDLTYVESLSNSIFYANTELTNVKLSNNCKFISYDVFYNCGNLVTIEFDGTVEEFASIEKDGLWNRTTTEKTITVTYK